MPINGALVLVPLDVTPVILTEATVLLLILETVPPVIPVNEMPLKVDATAPVNVYVPVWVFEANPIMLPVIVMP